MPAPRHTTSNTSFATKEHVGSREAKRAAAIYAVVVRQLVTKDNTFGSGASPFKHVFVLDHALTRTGRPRPLSDHVKALIWRRLTDLRPLDFVSDPKSVIDPHRGCAVVREHGALVTLGPIARAKTGRVRVHGQLFFACLGAAALTYVLEPARGSWRIVGTVGGRAVS